MPPAFVLEFPIARQVEMWLPMRIAASNNDRQSHYLYVVGRVKQGVSLEQAQAGMNVLVDLHVDYDQFLAMPREIQRDHTRGQFIHVDFLQIARDEKITVEVPVHIVGESHGVKEGGVVEHHLWELEVECFPQDVPSAIEADITGLGIGDSLKVNDLKVPNKTTLLTPEEETIVSIVHPQVLVVEEEVAEEVEGEAVEGEAEEGAEAPEGGEGATEGQPESPAERER